MTAGGGDQGAGAKTAEGLTYRPDIDGLRAVAVGGVLLFHAFPKALNGGFVGVDVFFVISGYLITSIVRGQTLAGRFSIGDFYERRIRRIFPALLTVLAATSIAALFVLPPEDLKTYAGSLAPAVAFVANFHFWTKGGYFDAPLDVRPLLHLWSLGVEEQFYLFWPPILIAVHRWPAKVVGPCLLVLVLASLGTDEMVVHRDAVAAFYATPLRAWEPLLGALLAIGWIAPATSPLTRQALGFAGLALIMGSMALLKETMPFPGLAAAPACLGAAMIIHAGRGAGATLVGGWLSARPAVRLGMISYSLYLWHWPILTFLRLGTPQEPPAYVMALGLALSVGLSVLTLWGVERRFRRRPANGLSRRRLFIAAFGGVLAVVACGLALAADDGLKGRASGYAAQAMAAQHDLPPLWNSCRTKKSKDPPKAACAFGVSRPGPPDVLLWGDSFAATWSPAVADWALAHGLKGHLATQPSCMPALGVDLRSSDGKLMVCGVRNTALMDIVRASPGLKAVVLVARWPLYDHETAGAGGAPSAYLAPPGVVAMPADQHGLSAFGLENLIDALSRNGPAALRIMIVGATPEFGINGARCAERAAFVHRDPGPCLEMSAAANAASLADSQSDLRAIAQRHPNVTLVLPNGYFCNDRVCREVVNGRIGFVDGDHLTQTAARDLGRTLTAGWPSPAPLVR